MTSMEPTTLAGFLERAQQIPISETLLKEIRTTLIREIKTNAPRETANERYCALPTACFCAFAEFYLARI